MLIRSLDRLNYIFLRQPESLRIQPAAMIAGKERVGGFMMAVAVLVVLLTLLLLRVVSQERTPSPARASITYTITAENDDA